MDHGKQCNEQETYLQHGVLIPAQPIQALLFRIPHRELFCILRLKVESFMHLFFHAYLLCSCNFVFVRQLPLSVFQLYLLIGLGSQE